MVYLDQIIHYSAGNDQFAFHTFLLEPTTDKSTSTTGRAHCGQLIICYKRQWHIKAFLTINQDNVTFLY